MTQYNFGTIDPYVVDGVQLAGMLNQWRDAMHSYHRGPTRPTYIVPGMLWIDDSGGATAWKLNVFLSAGLGDRELFRYNTTTGAITVSAASGGAFAALNLLAQGTVPTIGIWDTDNPIDQKRWEWNMTTTGVLRLQSLSDAGVVQQFVSFNRDGTITSSNPANNKALTLYAEQVLGANAANLTVTFPAAAKLIELDFYATNVAVVTGDFCLMTMLAGVAQNPATHNSIQTFTGTGGAAPGSLNQANQNAWFVGSGLHTIGGRLSLTRLPGGNFVANGQYVGAAGGRFGYTVAADGGPTTSDGFRLQNNGSTPLFATGSFLRCFVAL